MKNLFKGSKVMLTGPREGDYEAAAEWYGESHFARQVDTDIAFPRTADEMARFAERGPAAFPFYIRLLKGEALIGFASLHSIEWNNQSGTLSIAIGEARHRGKGYAAEALGLILQYAFLELNLHRVGLDVIAANAPALRLYAAGGFTEEGRARQRVFRDGKRLDLISMGLLRPEWEARQKTDGGDTL